jgi:hypothetical protein
MTMVIEMKRVSPGSQRTRTFEARVRQEAAGGTFVYGTNLLASRSLTERRVRAGGRRVVKEQFPGMWPDGLKIEFVVLEDARV